MTEATPHLVRHYQSLDDQQADFRNANLIELIANTVSGDFVADLGCGAGLLVAALRHRAKRVIGIEPSLELVRLAKSLHPDADIRQGSAENVASLLSEPVDAFILIDVLEHIEDDRSVLQKLRLLLQAHGELVILVPAYPTLFGIRDRLHGHFRRYKRKSFVKMLEEAGYVVKTTRYWNMLAVPLYFISERLLHRELTSKFRKKSPGIVASFVNRLLSLWFRYVENHVNLGFGLSLLVVARRKL